MARRSLPVRGRCVLTQNSMQTPAQSPSRTCPKRHQWIQRIGGASIRPQPHVHFRKQSFALHSDEVKNTVADRNSNSRGAAPIVSLKNSERQILWWKIRPLNVGRFNPTLYFRIVGLVDDGLHSRCRERRSSMGSVNEHEPNDTAKFRRAVAISSRLSQSSRQPTPSLSKRNACGDCSSSS